MLKTLNKLNKNVIRRLIYTGLQPPIPNYGGKYVITMIPGVGVGPELMDCVKQVVSELGVPIELHTVVLDRSKDEFQELEHLTMAIKRNGIAICGTVGFNKTISMDVQLRKKLKLDYSVAHIKSTPSIPCKFKDVDIAVIRQNTGVEFSMIEHSPAKGVVTYLKILSVDQTRKLMRFAFEYARANKRKKITAVHKANIMKMTDGYFLRTAREVAKEYRDIKLTHFIVDNCAMQLVKNPKQFDIIVTTNLYGMMISNILMGLVGGPGLASMYNVGEETILFETAARTVGGDIIGKNLVNPIAILDATANLIEYVGIKNQAEELRSSITNSIINARIRTKDIGGSNSTKEVLESILQHIQQNKTQQF